MLQCFIVTEFHCRTASLQGTSVPVCFIVTECRPHKEPCKNSITFPINFILIVLVELSSSYRIIFCCVILQTPDVPPYTMPYTIPLIYCMLLYPLTKWVSVFCYKLVQFDSWEDLRRRQGGRMSLKKFPCTPPSITLLHNVLYNDKQA